MVRIELTFPGGRYHATPWGRHVNEGAHRVAAQPLALVARDHRGLLAQVPRRRPGYGARDCGYAVCGSAALCAAGGRRCAHAPLYAVVQG